MRARWTQFWARSWWFKGPILGGIAFVALIIFGAAIGSGNGNNKGTGVLAAGTPVATQTLQATASPTPIVTATASPEPTAVPTPAPTQVPTPAPTPVPTRAPTPFVPVVTQYVPPPTPGHPAGATALCNDGTYSYAANHQGACSHHGGVAVFYN